MNALLRSALLAPIEGVINSLLAQDPSAVVRLQRYRGKVVRCECTTPIGFTCFLVVEDSRIALLSLFEGEADASISASASAFSKIAMSSSQTEALFSPEIAVGGDTHLIQALHQIIAQFEIDWEAHFAVVFGDVASHQLGKLFTRSSRWATQSKEAVLANVEEYIHEEARILPNKTELNHFNARIDELKLSLDRINARTARLHNALDKLSTSL